MVQDLAVFENDQLAQILTRRIGERTWGQVRELRVEVSQNQVLVTGRAGSYYLKQLAIQEALEVLPTTPNKELVVAIQVGTG